MSGQDVHTRPAWTIAVLAGGATAERDVSLNSGAAVTAALMSAGHRVLELDPVRDDLATINWRSVPVGAALHAQTLSVDAVFIALHGAFGEDGGVQRILEQAGMPYTGSDAESSALAFSKVASKQRFRERNVPTPRSVTVRSTDTGDALNTAAEQIGYPLVVKPDRQGSSIGVSIVESQEQLPAALTECFRFDTTGLLEEFAPGAEWTVAVIDDRVLPPICIGTPRRFYDYTAKYSDDRTEYGFDSATELTSHVAELGQSACRAIGTRGLARVDLRLDAAGQPVVLEVNTVPGMTDHSLAPKAAARVGLSMADLCEQLVWSALRDHQNRNNSHVQPGPLPTRLHLRAG